MIKLTVGCWLVGLPKIEILEDIIDLQNEKARKGHSFHGPPHTRPIATMAADTTVCWRYSALRIALIGPPASGKGGRSEPSQLLARTVVTARCCRMSPTAWANDRGTMGGGT